MLLFTSEPAVCTLNLKSPTVLNLTRKWATFFFLFFPISCWMQYWHNIQKPCLEPPSVIRIKKHTWKREFNHSLIFWAHFLLVHPVILCSNWRITALCLRFQFRFCVFFIVLIHILGDAQSACATCAFEWIID